MDEWLLSKFRKCHFCTKKSFAITQGLSKKKKLCIISLNSNIANLTLVHLALFKIECDAMQIIMDILVLYYPSVYGSYLLNMHHNPRQTYTIILTLKK